MRRCAVQPCSRRSPASSSATPSLPTAPPATPTCIPYSVILLLGQPPPLSLQLVHPMLLPLLILKQRLHPAHLRARAPVQPPAPPRLVAPPELARHARVRVHREAGVAERRALADDAAVEQSRVAAAAGVADIWLGAGEVEEVDSEGDDVEAAQEGERVGPAGGVEAAEEDDGSQEGRGGEADEVLPARKSGGKVSLAGWGGGRSRVRAYGLTTVVGNTSNALLK